MRILIVVALIIAAAASADSAAAQFRFGGAEAGAWCLWSNPWTYNCGFATLRQCLASASGEGGNCAPNPSGPQPRRAQRHPPRGD
ncbi:MAG TPA: DUF3551 domain-containing protein [Xanthobacteraceae bacterium]|nr:DUF3551 domain-containing protein [Xanthobacteraceae bacterium]